MTKSIFKILSIVLLLGSFTKTSAQQIPVFGQYFLNPYLTNPAYAGSEERAKAFLIYRRQWAEINGSPETQAFTLESRLKNTNVGLGLLLYNDVTNILGKTSAMLSSSVDINLTEEQKLKFGMSFGFLQNRIYFDRINADLDDEAFLRQLDQRTSLNGNFGLAYNWKSLKLGLAVDQLFENTITYESPSDFRDLNYRLVRHYFGSIQYDFVLAKDWTLTPLIAARAAQGLRSQIDYNLKVQYQDVIWLNGAYRDGFGYGFSLGFNVEDTYTIGYTYEVPDNALSIVGGNSHEVSIGIRFKRKNGDNGPSKKYQEPVSEEKFNELNRKIDGQYEKIDQLEQTNQTLRKDVDQSKKVIDEQSKQLRDLKAITKDYQSELNETVKELSVQPDEEEEEGAGYFLIVGAFKKMENAKKFQSLYNRKSGTDTRLIQSNSGTWFFIYTEQLETLKNSQSKINDQYGGEAKDLIIGNPWIFKKQPKTN